MTEIPLPRPLGNGIHLIPVPLPFKSPLWVNTYAIESDGGLLLIDCGTDWDLGRQALARGFADLGLEEAAVHTLLVSHLHPDHVGMAARLQAEIGCRFVMHRSASQLVDRYNDTPGYYERVREIASRHGVPPQLVAEATSAVRPDYMPEIGPPDHTVEDGDMVGLGGGRALEVLHTPGHDQAHICLRDTSSGVFFSGDHVLPRISPVIMYEPTIGDVLGDYLESLRRLIGLSIGVTYPAHGTLIDRGDERARQIVLHHDRRLLDMADLVDRGETSSFQVMLRSFRPNLDPIQARLALLETIAHLEHLCVRGRIDVEERDGQVFYRAG